MKARPGGEDPDHAERLRRKELRDQRKRDQDPIRLVRLVTEHPKKAFGEATSGVTLYSASRATVTEKCDVRRVHCAARSLRC